MLVMSRYIVCRKTETFLDLHFTVYRVIGLSLKM